MIINKREIKFRAYNRDWNMTLPVDEIKFENGEAVSVSVTIKASDYDHKGEWEDYIVGDEITIEQFTGLHDKNDKEIYEGDILGGIYDGGYISWCEKCKQFQYFRCKDECFACGGDVHWSELLVEEELEVIGNIHENPELLK